jgi:hypothetical protein
VVLLPADIEAPQERQLIGRLGPEALHADVVFAPHHGSAHVDAGIRRGRVAADRRVPGRLPQRFHHPEPRVLERWRQTGATLLRTDRERRDPDRLHPDRAPVIARTRPEDPRWWRIPAAAVSYWATQPPSIFHAAPRTWAAASEHRKTASSPSCSGVTNSPEGCLSPSGSRLASSLLRPLA